MIKEQLKGRLDADWAVFIGKVELDGSVLNAVKAAFYAGYYKGMFAVTEMLKEDV